MKGNILIIDSPGVIPLKENDEIRHALIGSRNVEKIKNKEIVAGKIIELFIDKKKISEFYEIKIENENPENILEAIGEKRAFIKKGGLIDEMRTAEQIIRDWQTGRLRL